MRFSAAHSGETRYLKAYLEFRCAADDGRESRPSAARYGVSTVRARRIRTRVDELLNSYYHHRRTRKRRVIPPSDQGET